VAYTRPNFRIGYLAHGLDINSELTIAEACAHASSLENEDKLIQLAAALAFNPNEESLQMGYDEALQTMECSNVQPVNVFNPLGLADIPQDKRGGELSGGQKTNSCWRACCWMNQTCSYWMNPPITLISLPGHIPSRHSRNSRHCVGGCSRPLFQGESDE
jgi:hypothetical protein